MSPVRVLRMSSSHSSSQGNRSRAHFRSHSRAARAAHGGLLSRVRSSSSSHDAHLSRGADADFGDNAEEACHVSLVGDSVISEEKKSSLRRRPLFSLMVVGGSVACSEFAMPMMMNQDEAFAAATIPPPADVRKPPVDAICEKSGLCSRILEAAPADASNKTKPQLLDIVTVDYTGWQAADGKMFDSSVVRGKPATFALRNLIKGWQEGVGLMTVGETRRMWIPEDLAYRGTAGRPSGMLVFDVTLRSVKAGPPVPQAPDDVASPPANAVTDSRGVKSVTVTAAPEGAPRPAPKGGKASISFACWSEDGTLVDASILRGGPQVVATDGTFVIAPQISNMAEGETVRVWVPNKVAFTSAPPNSAPKGLLVFEIKLLKVEK